MGTRSRSKYLSPVPAPSYPHESSGEGTSDDSHDTLDALEQPSRPHKNVPPSSPFTVPQLKRQLRQGERLLLTLLAEQYVDALLRQNQEKEPRLTMPLVS